MIAGIIFMLVGIAWFVFRDKVAAYQVELVAARFKSLPIANKDDKARSLAELARPLCLLLFGAGALLTGFHLLVD